jgi:parallel beta-helix repeat protein
MASPVRRRLARTRSRTRLLAIELLEDRTQPSVITVTGTGDDAGILTQTGPGTFTDTTLRGAITQANADPDTLSSIDFCIGSGVQTIQVGSSSAYSGLPLPNITHAVVIDATTQHGYVSAPLIVLDGTNAGGTGLDLTATAPGSTVKGLAIDYFSLGIQVEGNNNVIANNYLGVDATGNNYAGTHNGIRLIEASGNTIAGNVIASEQFGIQLSDGANDNHIQGNCVGLNADGTESLVNNNLTGISVGIFLEENADSNVIGGTTPGTRNVIAGYQYDVDLQCAGPSDEVAGNRIEGNYVGTDTTGKVALNGSQVNSAGILLIGHGQGLTDNVIGGTCAGSGNLISGMATWGVAIQGADGCEVEGNRIGTDCTGQSALPNGIGVIVIVAANRNVMIGGTDPGAGNTIAFNRQSGLEVGGDSQIQIVSNSIHDNRGPGVYLSSDPFGAADPFGAFSDGVGATGISIQRNEIYANGALGINLGTVAVDVNGCPITQAQVQVNPGLWDHDEPSSAVVLNDSFCHVGANNFQDFPVLNSATSSSSDTLLSGSFSAGTLNGQPFEPDALITLDFYANPTPDPTGYGQGHTYLGSMTVTTNDQGNAAPFSFDLPVGGLANQWLTATATGPDGSTSEFSADIPILASGETYPQFLEAVLPQSSTIPNSLTIQATTQTEADSLMAVFSASNPTPLTVPSGALTPIDIHLNFDNSISENEATVVVPQGFRLSINGGAWYGGSPALTLRAGILSISNATFVNPSDAPTVLVAGGSLTLRNDIIQESSNFTDAAIAVTGGTVDLGTASSSGNNTLNVNGTGQFVQNSTSGSVAAAGDTFTVNGSALAAPFLSFTSLTASPNPSSLNQAVTFTASVRPNGTSSTSTGSVDFFDTTTSTDLGVVPLSGGSASLTTTALAVGGHVIRANYRGDSTFLPGLALWTQQVQYNFSGFLPPLGQGLTFALGRTIPIKFQLTDFNRNSITSLSAITSLQVVYPDSSLHAIAGLRYDPTANQFIANWQTKGLAAGNYTLGLVLADGTTHTISLSLSKSGGSAGLTTSGAGGTGSAPGGLLGGNIELYVDNTSGNLTADQLARIQDAVSAVDAVTEVYGVVVEEVSDTALADVTLSMGFTSAVGGYADGVLGCTTDAGQITVIAGWNFYAGRDTTLITADQYDFETVVLHELGHALGLGHSADITSVMYATLDPGAAKRALVTADLNVPDTDDGACGLHAAVPGKGGIQDPPALVLPAEYRFGTFPFAAGPVPLAAWAQGHAAAGAQVVAPAESFERREGSRKENVTAAHPGLNRAAQDHLFAAEDDPFTWF